MTGDPGAVTLNDVAAVYPTWRYERHDGWYAAHPLLVPGQVVRAQTPAGLLLAIEAGIAGRRRRGGGGEPIVTPTGWRRGGGRW